MRRCLICRSPRVTPATPCSCCRSNRYFRDEGVDVTLTCAGCGSQTWLPLESPYCKPCLTEGGYKKCASCKATLPRRDFTSRYAICKECRAEEARRAPKGRLGFLYVLIDPRTKEICYVGVTIDPKARLKNHLRNSSKDHSPKAEWIREILALGKEPRMQVFQTVPRKFIDRAEEFWIAHFRERGCPLVNVSPGGNWHQTNHRHSREEVEAKRVANAKKTWDILKKPLPNLLEELIAKVADDSGCDPEALRRAALQGD
jgi:hypothetical protein